MVTSTRSKGAGKRRETPAKSGSSKKAKKSVAAAKLCTNDVDPDEASETTETKSVSEDSEGNPGENATPRKAYDGKPTILEYLQNKPTEVRNAAMHELVAEGYAGDKNASEEILGFMMSTTLTPVLVMMPGSSFPQIGHSLFQYNSSARKADENHRDFILFVGDRTIRGDPTGFVVDVDGGNMPGTLKEYDAHEDGVEIETFLQDPANDGMLFAQSALTTTKRAALQVLPINDDVAEFVAENNPSMHDLDAWVNHRDNNKVGDQEAANITDWMHMAILSDDNENKRKKSSILALDCQAVTSPTDELAQRMEERLDVTIGRAPERDVQPQNTSSATWGAQLDRRLADQERRLREEHDQMAKRLESKDAWSPSRWARWCGWSGQGDKGHCTQTLQKLAECKDAEDAIGIFLDGCLDTANKLNLRLTNTAITEEVAKMLMKGQPIPTGAGIQPIEANVARTFCHMNCVIMTSAQKDELARQQRALAQSTLTRTYEEARKVEDKEISGKLARSPPSSYHECVQVFEDTLIRGATLLSEGSPLVQLYQEIHDVLHRIAPFASDIPASTWVTLSAHVFYDETQYFATKASEADVIDGNEMNLPRCLLSDAGILHQLVGARTVPPMHNPLPMWNTWRKPRRGPTDNDRDTTQGGGGGGGGAPSDYTGGYDSNAHPEVKALMKEYWKQNRIVNAGRICTDAGINFKDFPEAFRGKCINKFLGKCALKKNKCKHSHDFSDILDTDVTTMCTILEPGIAKATEASGGKRR